MEKLTKDQVMNAKDLGKDHTVDDWPFGRTKRCLMHFFVESHPKRGERLVKQSTMDGKTYKPKKSTYAHDVNIVEIDGKVCYVSWHNNYRHFGVNSHDSLSLVTFFDDDAIELAEHFGFIERS